MLSHAIRPSCSHLGTSVLLFVRFISKAPARPIEPFVERLWQINDVPSHTFERIVPSGTLELVVNLREDEFRIYDPECSGPCNHYSGAIVSGPYVRSFGIDAHQHASAVGVHFRPGGAFPFLGVSPKDLADRHVDLQLLWGSSAVELRERLCLTRQPAERFRLLESALISRLTRRIESHYAVRYALRGFQNPVWVMTTRSIAADLGLSQRRFIEVFTREVGLTPKPFQRLKRFQRAFSLLKNNPAPDWTGVACDCGYFDQSHFIRDFKSFSGLQPSEFIACREPQVMQNHVASPGG